MLDVLEEQGVMSAFYDADPHATCWLHPALVVAPSPLHGVGLFAREHLPAGEVVSRLGGHLVTTETLTVLIGAAERGL